MQSQHLEYFGNQALSKHFVPTNHRVDGCACGTRTAGALHCFAGTARGALDGTRLQNRNASTYACAGAEIGDNDEFPKLAGSNVEHSRFCRNMLSMVVRVNWSDPRHRQEIDHDEAARVTV